jgi:aerobic-type carbon monoxide dehydrogenase small subunit (CoxS/CutS family)
MPRIKELQINGARKAIDADGERSLLSVLRDDLGLTGCKYGCGEGECGACTVILDGHRVRSCKTPVSDAANKPIRTVEGLANGDHLHPVQEAFLACGSMQCGYCTPGMIMAVTALLQDAPDASPEEVKEYLRGNICRCTGYVSILRAVASVLRRHP